MNNTLICKNCSTENPFYQLTCTNCSAYLRERIFNIDLWDILILLIESPMKAFARIIHSEHKNFIIFILFFAAIKCSITSIYLSLALAGSNHYLNNVFIVFLISLGILVTVILLTSYLFKIVLKSKSLRTRWKDNISIIIYSLIPYIIALIILFPVELILFGYTVFSVNPSPFIIKETLAYVMLGFEVLFILWAVFLSFTAFRRQSNDFLTAFIFTITFNAALYGLLILSAAYIYRI